MSQSLESIARTFLKIFATTPFGECYQLSREFDNIPSNPGFYAFRQKELILYIGVASNFKTRFRNGHRALSWAFLDRLDPDGVRIVTIQRAAIPKEQRSPEQIDYIERVMIMMAKPDCNTRHKYERSRGVRRLKRWENPTMQVQTEHLSPETAQKFLQGLPEKIRLGLLTYAAQIDEPVEAVIEMAIAGFLDEDAMTFSRCNPSASAKRLQPLQVITEWE